jgi:hypothetical protein
MKLIDCAVFGNVVRFYLGENDLTNWDGDDWNDRPFESNAGPVYGEYVAGYIDIAWNGDYVVSEPADHNYSKDDMKARRIPMVAVTPILLDTYRWQYDYARVISAPDSIKFYMGDNHKFIKELVKATGGIILSEHIKKLEPDFRDVRY